MGIFRLSAVERCFALWLERPLGAVVPPPCFLCVLCTTTHDSLRSSRKLFSAALVHRRGGMSAEVFLPSISVSFPSLRCHRVFLLVAALPRWVLCGASNCFFRASSKRWLGSEGFLTSWAKVWAWERAFRASRQFGREVRATF